MPDHSAPVPTPAVYAAINAVQAGLAKVGIQKARQNQQQHYLFRGIDDVYNALAPLLAEHKLCILPRVLSRQSQERRSQAGTPLFSVLLDVEYDLVSAEDGSRHTIRTMGEAMDSADKATNKAMSAAYKYACLQTFAIPTEGDNDADAVTPAVAAQDSATQNAATAAPAPTGSAPPPSANVRGNCPDHNKPFRQSAKGYWFCATKVGPGWCKRHPAPPLNAEPKLPDGMIDEAATEDDLPF